MPFAQQEDGVPRPGGAEGPADRLPAVGLEERLPPLGTRAGSDRLEDPQRFFAPGVLVGQDQEVAVPGGHSALEGALVQVPLAGGAEHGDQPPGAVPAHQGQQLLEGSGGMGVVHDHLEPLPGAHPLEPARDAPQARDERRHSFQGEIQQAQHDQHGGQEVLDVEGPRQRQAYRGVLAAAVQHQAGTRQIALELASPEVRPRVLEAVAEHRHPRLFAEETGARIVEVDDTETVATQAAKQVGLVGAVLLEATVELQVLMTDVGHGGGGELHVPQSGRALRQAVRGGLEDGKAFARGDHGREHSLDVRGFRGGLAQGVLFDLRTRLDVDGREESRGVAQGFEEPVQEPDRGAFAVGPGNPQDLETSRRMSEEGGRQGGQGLPGVRNPQVGDCFGVIGQLPAVQHRRGSAPQSLTHVAMPVGVEAFEGREQVSRAYPAGVVGQLPHRGLAAALELLQGN